MSMERSHTRLTVLYSTITLLLAGYCVYQVITDDYLFLGFGLAFFILNFYNLIRHMRRDD